MPSKSVMAISAAILALGTFFIMFTLKLLGQVAISWWTVWSPIWAPAAGAVGIVLLVAIVYITGVIIGGIGKKYSKKGRFLRFMEVGRKAQWDNKWQEAVGAYKAAVNLKPADYNATRALEYAESQLKGVEKT